jgi:hypothetical protein
MCIIFIHYEDMTMKVLLVIALIFGLAGCIVAPTYQPYASTGYVGQPYYAPQPQYGYGGGYSVAPVLPLPVPYFGFGGHHRHWR